MRVGKISDLNHGVTTQANLAKADAMHSRLDSASMMKSAHQATAYDKWLNAEIQEAIDDTSPAIPHDEAMRRIRAAIRQA